MCYSVDTNIVVTALLIPHSWITAQEWILCLPFHDSKSDPKVCKLLLLNWFSYQSELSSWTVNLGEYIVSIIWITNFRKRMIELCNVIVIFFLRYFHTFLLPIYTSQVKRQSWRVPKDCWKRIELNRSPFSEKDLSLFGWAIINLWYPWCAQGFALLLSI